MSAAAVAFSADQLVEQYAPLVRSVCGRFTLPPAVDREDLFQEGIIGLLDAAKKYDPARQIPFGAYATTRIRGSILDYLRRLDPLSRDDRKLVAARQMVKPQHLCLTLAWRGANTDGDQHEISHPELRSRSNTAETVENAVAVKALLRRVWRWLSEQERQVVSLVVNEDQTFAEAARTLGLSRFRVRNVYFAALFKMQCRLGLVEAL